MLKRARLPSLKGARLALVALDLKFAVKQTIEGGSVGALRCRFQVSNSLRETQNFSTNCRRELKRVTCHRKNGE